MPAALDELQAPPIKVLWPPLSWSLTADVHVGAQRPRWADDVSHPATGGRVGPAEPELVEVCWPRLLGRSLLTLGALMIAFAAFQLWGTSLLEWRAQRDLSSELSLRLDSADPPGARGETARPATGGAEGGSSEASGPAGAAPAPPPAGRAANAGAPPAPAPAGPAPEAPVVMGPRLPLAPMPALREGDVVGRVEIPAIGLSKVFLEGVGRETLRNGPGLYPSTALPGHAGTTAMAGHRTTHGAPFLGIDQLEPGDEIVVETPQGRFEYLVEGQTGPDGIERGHRIVSPDAVEVLADTGQNRLTLTACHPRYSARERIVVTALLVGAPLEPLDGPPAPPTPVARSQVSGTPPGQVQVSGTPPVPTPGTAGRATPESEPTVVVERAATIGPDAVEASLGWQHTELEPTVAWGAITALVAHGIWILGRLWRRRAARLIALPILAPCLFLCFVHLDRLLPAL